MINAEQALFNASGRFADVLVIGLNTDGEIGLASSDGITTAGDVIVLLERVKLAILGGEFEEIDNGRV